MSIRKRWALAAMAIATVAAFSAHLADAPVAEAADHLDPPNRAMGPGDSTDIGDLYAWHKDDAGTAKLVTVLTFAGPIAPAMDQKGTYDPDALYGIHIDNDDDNVADVNIYVRFGQNALGDWGMQVVGMPGEAGPVVGPVASTIAGTSGQAWGGLRDDPFFFDLQGFQDTLATGTLSFDASRDFFAGQNITSIVLEMPLAAAAGGTVGPIQVWATTSKI